jgi:single-stranded-DNA-specific exonuclease
MLIPKADIVINPKVSFDYHMKEICGAEVAWYLLAGLKNEAGFDINLVDYLDYLVLAIISDVMPLIDMNRALVKAGLEFLNKGLKPFSKVLVKNFQKIDSTVIAFQIAPRLNATGRLKKAELALNFLVADSYTQANYIYQELNVLNEDRKEIQEEIKESIEPIEYDRFVFAIGEYHSGVSGIIASKIVEKYKKPAIVFSKKDGILKGSGRSLGNVDLFKLINPLKDIYVTFGGHPGACGISIREEDFDRFAEIIDERSKELFSEEDYFIEEHIIGEIDFHLINEEMLELLEKYEPYGFGNPLPLFVTKDVNVEDVQIIKEKFLKMFLDKDGFLLEGIIFELPEKEVQKKLSSIKYNVRKNYFGNPSLILKEIEF